MYKHIFDISTTGDVIINTNSDGIPIFTLNNNRDNSQPVAPHPLTMMDFVLMNGKIHGAGLGHDGSIEYYAMNDGIFKYQRLDKISSRYRRISYLLICIINNSIHIICHIENLLRGGEDRLDDYILTDEGWSSSTIYRFRPGDKVKIHTHYIKDDTIGLIMARILPLRTAPGRKIERHYLYTLYYSGTGRVSKVKMLCQTKSKPDNISVDENADYLYWLENGLDNVKLLRKSLNNEESIKTILLMQSNPKWFLLSEDEIILNNDNDIFVISSEQPYDKKQIGSGSDFSSPFIFHSNNTKKIDIQKINSNINKFNKDSTELDFNQQNKNKQIKPVNNIRKDSDSLIKELNRLNTHLITLGRHSRELTHSVSELDQRIKQRENSIRQLESSIRRLESSKGVLKPEKSVEKIPSDYSDKISFINAKSTDINNDIIKKLNVGDVEVIINDESDED